MCRVHGSHSKMNLNELKDLAISAAKQAGDFLNQNKLEKKEVYQEEGRDIKLIIDQDTEKLIRSSLKKLIFQYWVKNMEVKCQMKDIGS